MRPPREIALEAVTDHDTCQVVDELAAVLYYVQQLPEPPRRVLEIGSEFGGTMWAWSQVAADDAVLVSVDRDHTPFRWDQPRGQQRLFLAGDGRDSHAVETFDEARVALGGPADFLYIDAGHDLEDVEPDWQVYSQLLSPDGICAFHDSFGYAHSVGKVVESIEGWTRVWVTVDHTQHAGWRPGTAILLPPSFNDVARG